MFFVTGFTNWRRRLMAALCLLLAAALVADPATASSGIKSGLAMCYNTVVPSLFPFIFLVDFLFSLMAEKEGRAGPAAAVVFAFIGGFPMGARALCRLADSGRISAERASILLAGCVNAGPAFLISAVGAGFFGSAAAGWLLFISLSSASLICLAVGAFIPARPRPAPAKFIPEKQRAASFAGSVSSALNSTLSFCAYVVFFSCLGGYVLKGLSALSAPPWMGWAARSLLEVVGGCSAAAGIGSTAGLAMSAMSVSLCGASVLAQIRAITTGSGLDIKYLLLFRPLHAALSLGILLSLIPILNPVLETWSGAQENRIFSLSPAFSVFFMLTAVIFTLCDKRAALFTKFKR